jgi:sugar fermentation stimulation protein A
VRRYKRFLADVELGGGEVVVAHCPDPGSMKTCAPGGARVWLSESDDPRRKLRHTWQLVEAHGAMVGVNPALGNRLVEEALAAGGVAELGGYEERRREARVGPGTRMDFLLGRSGERCWVEVKSVTLHAGGRVSAFPDSVTARGTRHLEELTRLAAAGDRAVLLYCCLRDPTDEVVPADDIDPLYGRTLRRAAAAGVEVLAYRCAVSPEEIAIRGRVPVALDRSATIESRRA